MNWKGLFKNEIVTASDKAALEKLDASTEKQRALCDRIREDFVTSVERIGRLEGLAGKIAENPDDEQVYQKLLITAAMPSWLPTGYQHRDTVLGVVEKRIDDLTSPQHLIVRKCLQRALAAAEDELKKQTAKEQAEAQKEGFDFVPSGRILALQNKILSLRNEIARPCPGEEFYRGLPHWRERLSEWL